MQWRRHLATLLAAAILLTPLTGLTVAADAAEAVAGRAVPMSVDGWNAGEIISDEVFFAKDTMAADDVQTFLNGRVSRCEPGYTCLKDYRGASSDRPADAMCSSPYQGSGNESAAAIIFKVAQACGINPQVLIVMLQKEQGLVTHTWPSDWRYTIAMGQGCPDTAACDTRYYGFFNQVYGAAWQLKRYANPPGTSAFFTWYAPGRTWNIRWNPDASCGSGAVFVANQATADLYYYTPYQPNAAALAAGSGEGDGCSAYGNRNFYNYFTDWFGSTRSALGSAVTDQYAVMGGAGGFLGAAVGATVCGLEGGGCYQNYAGGVIYWSRASGAWTMTDPIRSVWNARDYERGLGYPTGPQRCGLPGNACYQDFQRGVVYRSPVGTESIAGAIRTAWSALDFERGLGYPTGPARCGLLGDGCLQDFQRGTVYQSAAGAYGLQGPIRSTWAGLDYERGLGYPIRAQVCGLVNGGCYQDFERGAIYTSPSGSFALVGGIRDAWSRSDYERGLGYPTAAQVCDAGTGRCSQEFERGIVYSDAGGGHALTTPMRSAWQSLGEAGALGYPTQDETCLADGSACFQDFERGVVYRTKSGAYPLQGPIREEWSRLDYERGMGLPTAPATCDLAGGGCSQTFVRGMIHWSPTTGAHATSGAVLQAWRSRGLEAGALGYPVADQVCTTAGCTQRFQGGVLP